MAIDPSTWHQLPECRPGAPCPICGFPSKDRTTGEHRLSKPCRGSNDTYWRWREITGCGRGSLVRKRAPGTPVRKRAPRKPGWLNKPTGITPKIGIRLVDAAKLIAAGATMNAAAAALGTTYRALCDRTTKYAELWQDLVAKAECDLADAIRAAAAGDDPIDDPAAFTRAARRVQKALAKRGEQLFPLNGELTLSQVFEQYYIPLRLSQASPTAVESYRTWVRRWQYFTGDPPVKSITQETLVKFRDRVAAGRGMDGIGPKSPNTVRSALRHVQALLDKCGPRRPRYRDALGILQDPPWVKPPAEQFSIPRVVSEEDLAACYTASVGMDKPQIAGIKAPAWWRALLVMAFNSGLRRRTLFALRWAWIDWQRAILIIPPGAMKARRGHLVPLNETVLKHLAPLRLAGADLVFPFPHNKRTFYQWLHKLQDLAGLPRERRFGLHGLRRTLATALWAESPGAAKLMLGHAAEAITQQHYVAPGSIVQEALDRLPQPSVFMTGLAGEPAAPVRTVITDW